MQEIGKEQMSLENTEMKERPYVLTIGGFDPSGGAGVLADIKTMEALNVQGLAVLSARTIQTEDKFYDCLWERVSQIFSAVKILVERYPIKAVKIGIMPSAVPLMRIILYLHELLPNVPLVIDPVMRPSTSDYSFIGVITTNFMKLLTPNDLLTPNGIEFRALFQPLFHRGDYPFDTNILVTGGHDAIGTSYVTDVLYTPQGKYELQTPRFEGSKHGTGCIYSSAVASYLARGEKLLEACVLAQTYVAQYIASSSTLLGRHSFN